MTRAILSDLHGNLEALEAVLADLERAGVDEVACLGDFVGYGASPNECIERLRPRLAVALLGNHDEAAFDPMALEYFNDEAARAVRWTTGALTRENLDWLRALPFETVWHGARLVHASPSDPPAWNYVLTLADAWTEMQSCRERLCFVGHSHVPAVVEIGTTHPSRVAGESVQLVPGRRYLTVVPSVGQPRDGDSRAGYLLWDDEGDTLEPVRVPYDIARAQERIRAAGLPAHLAERLAWGQ